MSRFSKTLTLLNSLFVIFQTTLYSGKAQAAASTKNPFESPLNKILSDELEASPSLKIFLTGLNKGVTKDCCSKTDPVGGLERRFNFLEKEKLKIGENQEALFFDFGSNLFTNRVINPETKTSISAINNAKKVLKAMNVFPYHAINFGTRERSVLPHILNSIWPQAKAPWISTNVILPREFKAKLEKRVRLHTKAGEVLVLGLSDPGDYPVWKVEDPIAVLERELSLLSENVFPIVLSDIEFEKLATVAKSVKRPTLFLGSGHNSETSLREIGKALVVSMRPWGRDLTVFRFSPANALKKKGWYATNNVQFLTDSFKEFRKTELMIKKKYRPSERKAILASMAMEEKELLELRPQSSDIPFTIDAVTLTKDYAGPNIISPIIK